MRKLASALAIAFVIASLCGCVFTDIPLSDPAPSDADKLLYGRWRADGEEGYTIIEFAPPTAATPKARGLGDERIMVMTVARFAKGAKEPSSGGTERAFVTQVGDTTFLNVHFEHEQAFRILRYHLDGDTLDTWDMDPSATADALRRGDLLCGEVSYDRGSVSRVRITRALKEDGTSRNHMRALLTGRDADIIFPERCLVHYARVKEKK